MTVDTTRRLQALGVDPALILRFELADQPDLAKIEAQLSEAGLTVVAIEPSRRVVVVFRANTDLREFRQAMSEYAAGPTGMRQGKPVKSTRWDVFEWIEPSTIREWSREDRLGPRVRGESKDGRVSFDPAATYTLDLELWHLGTDTAGNSVAKVERLLREAGGPADRVCDRFIGASLCLVRVKVLGALAERLLELPEVAVLDIPPRCTFAPVDVTTLTRDRFRPPPRPPADGPRVCILDSGVVTLHPLLSSNVGHAAGFHSQITSAADGHGHGTGVAGLAVFGDVRGCIDRADFSSPVTLFSARLLDDNNRLDDEKLVVNQISDAVRMFAKAPHACRVFNLSFGDDSPLFALPGGKQGPWAQVLDALARELGVVFVVAAGNVPVGGRTLPEAERLILEHPRHLLDEEHGISDPGTAALAITVGAVAERADVSRPRPGMGQDIVRPVANPGEPAPYTRVGPGIRGAIKPEFVEDGGNMALTGFGGVRRLTAEPASAVWTLSREVSRTLFAPFIGTSFAAPRVARAAAMTMHALKLHMGTAPSANLVRAVLGAASRASRTDFEGNLGAGTGVRFTGYGRVDEEFALSSSDRRVVLVADERLKLDHFLMFEVPAPSAFLTGRGKKRLTVSLAFDPPVRGSRADYLGVEMDFSVFRALDADTLFEYVRKRKEDEEDQRPDIPERYKVALEPGSRGVNGVGNRSRSTLQVGRKDFTNLGAYSGHWWVVVRARRRWAGTEVVDQGFGIAVVLEAPEAQLYSQVRAKLHARGRTRLRM